MAGEALVNTWIVTLRGRRGTYGTGLALVARLVPRPRWDAAAFCVAGEVLAQPPRQRLRFSGGLLAVLHVDSVALPSELSVGH